MDFSYFIGKKLALHSGKSFTRLIMRLAIVGIAVSLSVMLLSVAIVKGFKKEVSQKVVGFDGHIQIRNLDLNLSRELKLIPAVQDFIPELQKNPAIKSINPFCSKAGIISTGSEIEGLLFKGVPANYDFSFFEKYLVSGQLPVYQDSTDSYDVMLSQKVSDALQLDIGKGFEVYFLEEGKVRRRKMQIVGIFNTGLAEFDRSICLAHIRSIQRIYTTDYSLVSGFEINLHDMQRMDEMADWVDGEIGIKLKAQSVSSIHSVIFQWLRIVDSNAVIIIVLMLLVAMINMVTAFLILIIERTRMIGVLKALGSGNWQVVKIFVVKGIAMIIPGIVIGNIIGLGLAWIQLEYGVFRLSEEVYYMSVVPMYLQWTDILWLNIGTMFLCTIILLIPGIMVRSVSPVKAIRFD